MRADTTSGSKGKGGVTWHNTSGIPAFVQDFPLINVPLWTSYNILAFLYNKTNQMHQFHKFILSWNCMFQTVPLPIISSLFTVNSATVYVIQVCRQLSSRTKMELQFHPGPARKLSVCLKAVYKPVWHIPLLSVQWINCWWWTDELSETCRVSCQNKFVKLVHLVGFIIKKFVTMHGHTNIKTF